MENPEKLATQGTQEEEKQYKNTTQCVEHHYAQTKGKSFKIPKGFSEILSRSRTENTMAKLKKQQQQKNNQQHTTQKTKN